jgi:dolichol-phosphate mannosyltransferase
MAIKNAVTEQPIRRTILPNRLKKFILVGLSSAVVNVILIVILIEILLFDTYLLRNIANIFSIEVSIVFNYILSRIWTWGDAPKKYGKGLIAQFISFNLAALSGILIRVSLFAALDKLGIVYLVNVFIGIGVAATVDFILYDKLIFRRVLKQAS